MACELESIRFGGASVWDVKFNEGVLNYGVSCIYDGYYFGK
jgi:hypothetical protein